MVKVTRSALNFGTLYIFKIIFRMLGNVLIWYYIEIYKGCTGNYPKTQFSQGYVILLPSGHIVVHFVVPLFDISYFVAKAVNFQGL